MFKMTCALKSPVRKLSIKLTSPLLPRISAASFSDDIKPFVEALRCAFNYLLSCAAAEKHSAACACVCLGGESVVFVKQIECFLSVFFFIHRAVRFSFEQKRKGADVLFFLFFF